MALMQSKQVGFRLRRRMCRISAVLISKGNAHLSQSYTQFTFLVTLCYRFSLCDSSFWHVFFFIWTGSSGSPTGSIKTLLPLSSSSPLHPFAVSARSCHDAALHTLTLPLYGKTSTASPLPSRAFSSLGVDRLRGLPPLPDLPFLSALQPKKPLQCRDPCPGSLFPLHGPFGPHGPSLLPHLSDTAGPYCFYRYSFPLNPQLTALSRHAKLAEDTTDCLLRPSPWHPTTNHCLWQLDRTFRLRPIEC